MRPIRRTHLPRTLRSTMPMQSSHYERLKLAERATVQDVHAAWKAAVDRQQRVAGQSPIAQAVALADLQVAYEVLSDPRRRAEYDQQLAARRPARTDRPDQVVDGAGPHSANDDQAGAPSSRHPAAALRLGRAWLRRLRLPALNTQHARWAAGVAVTGAVAWWAGMAAGRVPPDRPAAQVAAEPDSAPPRQAPAMPRAAAEAHGQWLHAAGRTVPHPLDGEPLRLRR